MTDWSHNKIYQISLENGEVRAVGISVVGNANAVVFNSATNEVIWSSTNDQTLHSVYLNGSDYKTVYRNGKTLVIPRNNKQDTIYYMQSCLD